MIIGPPGATELAETGPGDTGPDEAAMVLRVPSRVNALSVSTRDAAATAAPARWSFRIYHPFLGGDPRHYAEPGRHRK
jgi:hypothetical protein